MIGSFERAQLASDLRPASPRSIRVLHVGKFYPPNMGGIETHLQALCGELSKCVDVRVVVANDLPASSEEVLDGVPVSRVATPFSVSSAPICPGMIAKIRRSGADIVHIHLPNPSATLAYLLSGHRGRLVITYHSDSVRQKMLGAAFEPFLRAALKRSSAIIVSSPNYLESSRSLRNYRSRCHVIPFGIELGAFGQPDPAAVDVIRKQYGGRLVLSVGRLVYYKGFEHLIQAMSEVRGKLLIVGDGPLREPLERLVSRLGLQDRVCLLGHVPGTLVPYYHAADIFALPSIARSEAFGIVQVEAMAAGLPIVNTQLDSGVPYVSPHEQTGLTVPPANAGALAAAINRLLDDDELRGRFGNGARHRAESEFSLPVMTSRTLAVYAQVMNPR